MKGTHVTTDLLNDCLAFDHVAMQQRTCCHRHVRARPSRQMSAFLERSDYCNVGPSLPDTRIAADPEVAGTFTGV